MDRALGVHGDADADAGVHGLGDAAEREPQLRGALAAQPARRHRADLADDRRALVGEGDHAEGDPVLGGPVAGGADVLPLLAAELEAGQVHNGVLGDLDALGADRVGGRGGHGEPRGHEAFAVAVRGELPRRGVPERR
ncbi:hypothetical protein JCM33774_74230 [Actinophytocola sp. KF-1]